MGYQLNWVTLWFANVERPNCQYGLFAALSTRSGGVAAHCVHLMLGLVPLVAVQLGAIPVASCAYVGIPELTVPRSAGSCSSRIAFGLIGFGVGVKSGEAAGVPPPDCVGALVPRANPSASHSLVTGTHTPELFRYSTRR